MERAEESPNAHRGLRLQASMARDEIEQLFDDKEKGDLYMSRKLLRNFSRVKHLFCLKLVSCLTCRPFKGIQTSRASGISAYEENDVEELEKQIKGRLKRQVGLLP